MKGDDIAVRLLDFGAAVLKLCREMPADPAGKHVSSAYAVGNWRRLKLLMRHAVLRAEPTLLKVSVKCELITHLRGAVLRGIDRLPGGR